MKSYYFDYQGARLHYQIGGLQSAPVMVLLHGGFGSINDFAALLPRLQAHYRIVAIDTRGHGQSTMGNAVLTYAQIADDARRILQDLHIEQYSLFGFSDGGTAAYKIGAADNNVEAIITVGASWHKDQLLPVRSMFKAMDANFVQENMPEQAAAYQAQNPQADLAKLTDALKTMWLDEGENGYPNEHMGRIQAPVLAIRGEADFLYSLSDWVALKNELPDVHLMNVPFATHEAIKEQPEMVWAAIQAFQAGIER
ncbi:MAG: alpha/beta fold hydrolase [Neisseria sp.]|uniref:alpha/beta fold hydrolase n=1 Tax=Neisseria sp. TaxID=192066 RepID=UPI0026DC0C46|nr:alpha/beta fold hydrolase [Neisseria sp.]MDO4640661.1 alpha/beta fold hydrolase [Neisseria sp.]